MSEKYQFTAQDQKTADQVLPGSSWIRGAGDIVLCLGQLKTLFGEPLYVTKDMENQYSYCILAVSDSGKRIYLDVYSGPTGPAIGGQQDADSQAAADALAELIDATPPADYDYEGYYLDGPCIVRQGIRAGVPYQEEDDLTDEAFQRACEELYHLTIPPNLLQ